MFVKSPFLTICLMMKNLKTLTELKVCKIDTKELCLQLDNIIPEISRRTLEATTQYYDTGDCFTGVIHPKDYHALRLHKFSVKRLQGLVSADYIPSLKVGRELEGHLVTVKRKTK